jgi:hypothetical protein
MPSRSGSNQLAIMLALAFPLNSAKNFPLIKEEGLKESLSLIKNIASLIRGCGGIGNREKPKTPTD